GLVVKRRPQHGDVLEDEQQVPPAPPSTFRFDPVHENLRGWRPRRGRQAVADEMHFAAEGSCCSSPLILHGPVPNERLGNLAKWTETAPSNAQEGTMLRLALGLAALSFTASVGLAEEMKITARTRCNGGPAPPTLPKGAQLAVL